jgi:hypothetical protein
MSECECITIANANTSAKGGVGRGPVGGKRVRLCDTYVRYATQRARLAQLFIVGSTQGRRRADTKCESISSATARKRKASVSELSKDKAIRK